MNIVPFVKDLHMMQMPVSLPKENENSPGGRQHNQKTEHSCPLRRNNNNKKKMNDTVKTVISGDKWKITE